MRRRFREAILLTAGALVFVVALVYIIREAL